MSERKKVGIYIDAALWKRVRIEAMDRGMSASALLSLAVDQWMAPHGPWQRQGLVSRALGAKELTYEREE